MSITTDPLARGGEALATGDWEGARAAFVEALEEEPSAAAEEGLGRALWWLQDTDGAIAHVERAYAMGRASGDTRGAAANALWLSREFSAAYGNAAVSAGWFARAEGLLRGEREGIEIGWLALTSAERSDDPAQIAGHAARALGVARGLGDAGLEAAALVRLGYAEVASGEVASGMAKVDEALTATTGGEVANLETIGDVICAGIAACELAADWQRIEQWGQAVEGWIAAHNHVAVLGFCYACCAEMFIASGQWEMADGMLAEGLSAMRAAKLQARCVHPAAKLAELRVSQGRLEEAEQLLAGFEELPESTHALASLHLAKGETAMAAAVLLRRLNAIERDNVLSAPFLALLVDVQLAQGDASGAGDTAARLESVAGRSALARLEAMARLARGRVLAATNDPKAPEVLGAALSDFASQQMPLDAARARFELARALDGAQPEVAMGEARTALAEFERLGAPREADAAAAFLRKRGVAGRTGPKGLELLSRREREVLALLGEGLTNAEIAARLYISTKTAGNHVSSVLSKLNLRSRTEAAAYAVRYGGTPAGK
ncbi:MAG TPA: LuxR C-terminal-related transcriptional regulator [Actinomycetota bacterium]|nr:LuxR C-terminal-related transcriptional regulator [Actinomycetota bacterium]